MKYFIFIGAPAKPEIGSPVALSLSASPSPFPVCASPSPFPASLPVEVTFSVPVQKNK
jgi:hypothetical protein